MEINESDQKLINIRDVLRDNFDSMRKSFTLWRAFSCPPSVIAVM